MFQTDSTEYINKIFNEDCFETMDKLQPNIVDIVLTSPFYNTNKKAGKNRNLLNTQVKKGQYDYVRYDVFVDNMTDEQYAEYTSKLFNSYNKVLKPNGCVIYNISYGSENTECMFKAINSILVNTDFTIADVICWKKKNAFPNSCSSNKLTRIWEFVFVFCRKKEIKTFYCNKQIVSERKSGQKMYENIFNFIEARNNDETCPYNKATYSTELCEKLLKIYCPPNGIVYDSFMGSGTTALACKKMNLNYIGSEISSNQVEWANKRLNVETAQMNIFDFV